MHGDFRILANRSKVQFTRTLQVCFERKLHLTLEHVLQISQLAYGFVFGFVKDGLQILATILIEVLIKNNTTVVKGNLHTFFKTFRICYSGNNLSMFPVDPQRLLTFYVKSSFYHIL